MSRVDQENIYAGGDVVGGNKGKTIVNHNRKTQFDQLMEKLESEIEDSIKVQKVLDSLQYYFEKHSDDGIEGLENKLDHSGRTIQKNKALKRKEYYAKLMDKWAHYGSAQEIFALLLAKIDVNFETNVEPYLGTHSAEEIDKLIKNHVIDPVVSEIGGGVFSINDAHVSRMVYWLAEQCFVRWHK